MNRSGLAAVAAAVLVLSLSGCASSANATACKLYEDAYNGLADLMVVHNEDEDAVEPADVLATAEVMAAQMREAYERAEGDVAVEMLDSASYAAGMTDDPTGDIGTAFFLSKGDVADACGADGAAIDLHEFSDDDE